MVGTPSKTVHRSRSMTSSAFSRVEARHQRQRRAGAQRALSAHVWPKEWNSGSTQHHRRLVEVEAGRVATSALRREVGVRELGALGLAGGAGGVEDHGGVGAGALGRPRRRLDLGQQAPSSPGRA
jgi:hypothetical protein